MDAVLTAFLANLGTLSAPALMVIGAAIFMWLIATQRLVPGRQYKAERERGDKYEAAHQTATAALIENVTDQKTTIAIVSSFREELARLTAKGGGGE